MKAFTYTFFILTLVVFYSCQKDSTAPPEPLAEAVENGELFTYFVNEAGFKNQEFHIKISSHDAYFIDINFFLEDFQEKTYHFGINTFNEVRLNDLISTDFGEPNTGFITIEEINREDSTFSASFEFFASTARFSNSPRSARIEKGVLKNIPFSAPQKDREHLHRLSMIINDEQFAIRAPFPHGWHVSDSSILISEWMHKSGYRFTFALQDIETQAGSTYNIEDLNNYDIRVYHPRGFIGEQKSITGTLGVIKNDPDEFLAEFNFDIEYEDESFQIRDGIISIK